MTRWSAVALLGAAFGAGVTLLVPRVLPSASRGASGQPTASQPAASYATSARSLAKRASQDELGSVRDAILRGALQAQSEAETDPSRKARETFDRRLAEAPADAANTARMEQALHTLVDSGVLGKTTSSFICGATTCRLDLKNPDPAGTESSVQALVERLPKLFSRTLSLPTAPGERAVYLTTDPAALSLAPPSEHVTIMPAPSAALRDPRE